MRIPNIGLYNLEDSRMCYCAEKRLCISTILGLNSIWYMRMVTVRDGNNCNCNIVQNDSLCLVPFTGTENSFTVRPKVVNIPFMYYSIRSTAKYHSNRTISASAVIIKVEFVLSNSIQTVRLS